TRPGGTVAAYLWDYAGKMEMLRFFWDAAVEFDAGSVAMDEGVRFPLCNPEALGKLFAGAALQDIEVTAIDVQIQFSDFNDYWQPFLGGQGPAPAYLMSLDDRAKIRLQERLRERLPVQDNESILLTARSWAVRGTLA